MEHTPACPLIRKMSHFVKSGRELDNCPATIWEVFRKRRLERGKKYWAISPCGKYWPKAKELNPERPTGNKSFSTLESFYMKKAPKLRFLLSVPLRTVPIKSN